MFTIFPHPIGSNANEIENTLPVPPAAAAARVGGQPRECCETSEIMKPE